MFESITYETILRRMLSAVATKVDKREGSIIWDALAPAAAELKMMYIELDRILLETFADTASREYLVKRAAERGLSPEPATRAVLRGSFDAQVNPGDRFSLDALNYVVVVRMDDGDYRVQCETAGTEGNRHLGTLIPIEYIPNLTRAELTGLLVPGEDEEDTEVFRQRYMDSLLGEAFGGNVKDYIAKVKKLQGVGGVKVHPTFSGGYKPSDLNMPELLAAWLQSAAIPQDIHTWLSTVTAMVAAGVVTVGAGTIRVVFLNTEFEKPSPESIDEVQTLIDPEVNRGEGLGTAPIGHTVTVTGAEEAVVNISTHITLQDGYTWGRIEDAVSGAVEAYLQELRQSWEDSQQLVVRISQLETRILAVPGVMDIARTAINGAEENLVLGVDEIPMGGAIIVT